MNCRWIMACATRGSLFYHQMMTALIKICAVAMAQILLKACEHVAHYVQMSDVDPKRKNGLLKTCASIMNPRLLFDPVLHDTVACSAPVSVRPVRVTAP